MSTPPNVLFVFTDQQRPDWFEWTDVPVRTPRVAALADRGVRFEDAVCPSPVCNPCRAAVATGMAYDRCGVRGNNVDLPLSRPTLYGRLRDEAGYHVMGCGKFDLQTGFPGGLSGAHDTEQYGFSAARFNPALNNTVRRFEADVNGEPRDPYTAYLAEEGLLDAHVEDYRRRREEGTWTATFPTELPQEAYYDEWITRQGLDLLDSAPADRPWFLEVDLQNPHHPWDVTEEMHGWYRDPDVEFPEPVNCDLDVTDADHQAVPRNYAAMIEHLDRCLGRFLDALEERGELEETLVVFASDHGEMLGDHGQWQKLSPLHASVGVPLIAAGPGVADQSAREEPVTILDLHSTFLDRAGLDSGGVDSRSMVDTLAGGEPPREVVHSGLSSWRMAYDGRYKLVEGYDPDLRRGGDFEPMRTAPENTARRRRERERILHEVSESESENVAGDHPDAVERLHGRIEARVAGGEPS
jgi:arylsulfatase A-like enzyme